jgi:predicted ArsR family transcriptional regulator
LDNQSQSQRNPADHVLMLLKMHGALTAAALAKKLGTTGEAARQQLIRLADNGLVSSKNERAGVGRPTQHWSLTSAAQARFPDTHAALTVQIIDIIRDKLGENALDEIIGQREEVTRCAYDAALSDSLDLRGKVSVLSALRSAEGYMADWQENDDGSILLIENHCPICAAATRCEGFCRAELQVFRSVLGPAVAIDRTEHIVSGGRRCAYLIRHAAL